VVGLFFKIGPARLGAAGAWATAQTVVPYLGGNLAQHGTESPEMISKFFFTGSTFLF